MALEEAGTPARTFVLSALACGLALAGPALVVAFPVSTDLPQHLAQAGLFAETLRHPDGPYVIQWGTPYLLGYAVPVLASALAPPELVGQLTLLMCALLWSGAVHTLAAQAGRGLSPAVLACVPFFGTSLHWGFLNFLVGFAVFALFFVVVRRTLDAPARLAGWLWMGASALGLYFTHLLWFGAGTLVVAILGLRRRAWRQAGPALAALLPSLVLASWSALRVHESFDKSTVWGRGLLARLDPAVWGEHAFGPSRDVVPATLLVVILVLVVVGMWQHRGKPACLNPDLLWVGALFLAFTLVFPTRYTNTIQFEARWASPAMALLVLGTPMPRLRPQLLGALSAALLLTAVMEVSVVWWRVNDEELSGLEESLAALPEGPRVLGLSYQQESRWVRGRPFLQTFAWAQVRHGGELNFSFAEFSVMPVVFRVRRSVSWTRGLEWHPERIQLKDFGLFDFVLVSGSPVIHERLLQVDPALHAVTNAGVWRLYRSDGGERRR